jgi:8-hydroxy-5-deazaflavin:NADPH oxidoreductase
MTTAIIGTGVIGSVIARQLASGGETLRLSSADNESARTLAAKIGRAAAVAAGNRDALQGAGAVVLALRFTVLKGVIDEIADPLAGKLVVVPSNPLSVDAQGNLSRLLPEGQSSGEVVAAWLPAGVRLAMAFGTLSADLFESSGNRSPEPAVLFYAADDDRAGQEVERLIRTAGFEPVKARPDRTVESTRGGRRPSRSRSGPRRGTVIDRCGLIASPPWSGAPLRSGLHPEGIPS